MINTERAYYIKLGKKGRFEQECLGKGIIGISYREVPPMELFDHKVVYDTYAKKGKKPSTCSNHARQVRAFYTADDKVLWITFANGKLYWCIAGKGVNYINKAQDGELSRYRPTLNGWSDQDLRGNTLYTHTLNGNLTKTARYQGTICEIEGKLQEYLSRRINGKETLSIITARKNKSAASSSIVELMKLLNPADFELLVELAFSRSGWQRLNETGGSQKTADFELYIPILNEYAFVQVKTKTTQKELQEYEEQLEERDDDYMFYVYHTAKKGLTPHHPQTRLIDANNLAEIVLNAGLYDWLLKKTQ